MYVGMIWYSDNHRTPSPSQRMIVRRKHAFFSMHAMRLMPPISARASCPSTPFVSHFLPITPLIAKQCMLAVCPLETQKEKEHQRSQNRMVSSRLKEILFFLCHIERRRLFLRLQEFRQDDPAMMSSADRLLCLLWSFPLCLGAPVGR